MRISDEFFHLLRAALLGQYAGDLAQLSSIDENGWKRIASLAREQSISGLIGDAVSSLPEEAGIPDNLFYYFVTEREKAAMEGRRMAAASKAVSSLFANGGLHPVLMKGPATAAYYPHPELRTYGDIDLYFSKDEFIGARALVAKEADVTDAGDGSFHFKMEGVDVDVHRKYFDLHRPEKDLPDISSPEASIIMLSAHGMKHACGTGIGLRQICDVAMAYRSLEGRFAPQRLEAALRSSGMFKWQRLLCSFIINRLGIQVPCPGGKTVSDSALLKIVEEGGNFGHYAEGRGEAYGKSAFKRKADTLRRFIKRMPFSLRYAPGETLRTMLSLSGGNLHL